MRNNFFLILGFVFANPFFCFSQKDLNISVASISSEFISDAHYITIDRNVEVEIVNQNESKEKFSETFLILDKKGLFSFKNGTSYDQLTKITDIQVSIYDSEGKFVKKIEEDDFIDVSLVDGYSIYNDNRRKYAKIDYSKYPFFAKIEYSKVNDFTIFIPSFFALEGEDQRVLSTDFVIKFPNNIKVNTFETQLEEYGINKKIESNKISYSGKNLKSPDFEDLNLRYLDLLPEVRFSIDHFSIYKISGNAQTWGEFGKWYHKNFLAGLDVLPNSTVAKMKEITKNAKSELDKVKIIFEYVQKNTRYVSIQAGIGGWKPFSAKEVDKLKYGDCKALTNYTKALLKAVGVNTYYTVLYASSKIKDINEDIIGIQGNHVILSYPYNNGYIFIECTNQVAPFGHLNSMIDDRKVLLISENGSEIISTKSYKQDENQIKADFLIDLSDVNRVKTEVNLVYSGLFYNDIFDLNIQNSDQVTEFIQYQFSNLKDLKIIEKEFVNDKEEILYKTNFKIESSFIGGKAGSDYLVQVNPFTRLVSVPKKYRERKSTFEISRKKQFTISAKYILPQNFSLTFVPENQKINSKFGDYEIEYIVSENDLIVNEFFKLNNGSYPKEDYESYREFLLDIQKSNFSKFILSKL